MAYASDTNPFLAHMMIICSARYRQQAVVDVRPTKPAIYASLNKVGCGILSPVLDSLFVFFEIFLKRSFRAGYLGDRHATRDELLLLAMFQSPGGGQSGFWKAGVQNEPTPLLKSALKSTRRMLTLVLGQRDLFPLKSCVVGQTRTVAMHCADPAAESIAS